MPAINGAGKVLGAFAIYSDTPRTPAQNELMVGQIAVELSMIAVDTAQTQERLASQAMHDDLTQLPNRRYIGKLLTQKKSARDGLSRDGFLLLIDLDDFKPVNDTYGHLTGDEVLKEVAQRLLRIVCEEDTVARMGGDEFS
ncbi:sensory box protein [Brucella vulpis]|nr:response regulator PleD [Brucella vulpis]CUW51913.1 sensory box protein [Brucella vulpis]